MQPLLDIGIPCFNHYKYLRRCIESIHKYFKNDADKIWIWICDDCSNYSEEYLKIIDDYKNIFNFSYIKNEINSGPGISRNHVIEKGQGKWITFIDDDDVFCNNPINEIVNNNDINFFSSEIYQSNEKLFTDPLSYINVMYGIILSRSFLMENNVLFPENSLYAGTEDSIFRVLIFSLTKKIKIINSFITHMVRGKKEPSNYVFQTSLVPTPPPIIFYNFKLTWILNFTYIEKYKNNIQQPEVLLESLHIFLSDILKPLKDNSQNYNNIIIYYRVLFFYYLFYIFNFILAPPDIINYLKNPKYKNNINELFYIFYSIKNFCNFTNKTLIYQFESNKIIMQLNLKLIPDILKNSYIPIIFNYNDFNSFFIKCYQLLMINEERKNR